ncbi:zinc metalloprotease HtpX [Sulfurimonas sp. HSL3-7]|uniref:zinc metalloprotease HtpX n=1 Tax=Sulfonitrofixus jiaomeiensis TaxID=3131938 RepID=UPI0031F8418B
MELFKTFFLMGAMTLLLVWAGGMLGGQQGMTIAFLIALGMNFFSYYNSDKLVLHHYNAVEVSRAKAPGLYAIVERLSHKGEVPMPKVYIIPDRTPNAFATGRNPSHAAVAVTEGLLELLDEEEVEAVLAHELSHVRHYDILIGSVAATMAGAIALLAQFGIFFRDNSNRQNPIVMIALMIIMPLVATVIQMAVSRNREFIADEGAARLTGHPEWLQRALAKLDNYARRGDLAHATQQTAHMFIINPFSGHDISFKELFSTHPSTQNRIDRLEQLKQELR